MNEISSLLALLSPNSLLQATREMPRAPERERLAASGSRVPNHE
jgi:hypothetical protein